MSPGCGLKEAKGMGGNTQNPQIYTSRYKTASLVSSVTSVRKGKGEENKYEKLLLKAAGIVSLRRRARSPSSSEERACGGLPGKEVHDVPRGTGRV